MKSSINFRAEIQRHVAKSGVNLPDATIDELVAYLEDLHANALDDGATPPEARGRAMAALEESAFSMLQQHAVKHRDRAQAARADLIAGTAGGRSLNVVSSIRLAVRQFRQHPSFALVTVLVLGLGVGAATTVFTVVDSVVLRPLPYVDPDRLVTLWDTNIEKGLAHDPISPVNFMDDRALPVFQDAAAWWVPSVNLVDPGQDPVRVNTIEASGNLFDVLGVSPQLGEGFPKGGPLHVTNELICVISDRLWRTRYSADRSIIGRPIVLNGTPYIVRGVMPAKFHFPDDVDVWQRLRWPMERHSRDAHFMEAVARLAPGTSIGEAQAAIDSLTLRLATEFPASNKGWGRRLIPLLDEQLGYYRPALMVLFGAVGLLLVIGCLNVASLLLTRALSREKEIAVRVAMGASPRQLIAQLLAESAVLSVAGAAAGTLAAMATLPLVISLMPVSIPRLEEAGVNGRALLLGLVVIIGTTIFFGLVPALVLVRSKIVNNLRTGERGSSRGARAIYSVLVAGEVALACALLVSSGLLVRTVGRLMDTPTGIDANDVVVSSVQLSGRDYTDWRKTGRVHGAIIDTIRRQPGVIAAGASNFLPFEVGWRGGFGIEGEPPPARPEDAPQVQYLSISDGYFEAMGATMAQGRAFMASDEMDTPGVVIVNETFAQRFFSDGRAVGRAITTMSGAIGPLGFNLVRIRPRPPGMPPPPPGSPPVHLPPTPFEVIGVVKDVRNAPFGQPVEPALYFTTRQYTFREQYLAVKAIDRAAAVAAIRTALQQEAPNVPMGIARSWGDRFADRTAEPRLLMTILLFFGALAGLLAALGVYGLFSWSVALRTRELAIRLTLGAKPAEIGALVMKHSAMLVATGLVIGVVIIRFAEGALSRVVFGVTTSDATALIAASAVLLLAALVACVPPALRAMRVDPVEGLRAE
ncbi:MAG TPA: ADOP family duplicated permease [Vicinamibacterales bacterium]|nr:ADOP family duplicated permease [Vicinamibacterales bacterium]